MQSLIRYFIFLIALGFATVIGGDAAPVAFAIAPCAIGPLPAIYATFGGETCSWSSFNPASGATSSVVCAQTQASTSQECGNTGAEACGICDSGSDLVLTP